MPQYSFTCEQCQTVTTQLRLIADRDEARPCETCKGPLVRLFEAPSVLQASLPMGVSRKDSGYQKLKEASKLEVLQAGTAAGSPERKQLASEIQKLKTL